MGSGVKGSETVSAMPNGFPLKHRDSHAKARSIGNDPREVRIGLLHRLLPRASRIAMLTDSASPASEVEIADVRMAAAAVEFVSASTDREIETIFASLAQKRIAKISQPAHSRHSGAAGDRFTSCLRVAVSLGLRGVTIRTIQIGLLAKHARYVA
jgi:hypothetical protein